MLQMEMSAGTEGSVLCTGCLCRDDSGNNWPSIDDFYSAKISACRVTSLPRMQKTICAEKEPGPPQEATPQIG